MRLSFTYVSRELTRFVSSFLTRCLLWCAGPSARADVPSSDLDRRVNLPGFGSIAYRAPLPHYQGPLLVLFHGIFAGSTHRSFTEILPLLDAADARVYLVDLPGTGESASPKRTYDMALLDAFVESFLENVVAEPAVVVTESIMGTPALKVASTRRDLIGRVILLSPTGIHTLAEPPSAAQTKLFNWAYGNDVFGLLFYEALLSDPSLRYFLKRAYADPSHVTESLLDEYRSARTRLGQRWISFAFVGGQLYRQFADVAPGVHVPVLAIFGRQAQSPAPNIAPDTAANFAAIRPDFAYSVVDQAGLSVQREQPEAVVALILDFAKSRLAFRK
jgi:pimeloyl-ACP methyl ester carboxylesterase